MYKSNDNDWTSAADSLNWANIKYMAVYRTGGATVPNPSPLIKYVTLGFAPEHILRTTLIQNLPWKDYKSRRIIK